MDRYARGDAQWLEGLSAITADMDLKRVLGNNPLNERTDKKELFLEVEERLRMLLEERCLGCGNRIFQ